MMRDAGPVLAPGNTIGILGGGQLGRMLALAASRLGIKCHIFCPDHASPAAEVSYASTVAVYDDKAALQRFARAVDVVTYEFENVPSETVEVLLEHVAVRPGLKALQTAQDRLTEKGFLRGLGLNLADFRDVSSIDAFTQGLAEFNGQGVLKTRRFGYDGKGQVMIRSQADLEAANKLLVTGQPLILEAFVPFLYEVSVIAARDLSGHVAAFEIGDNVHRHHILHTTTLPSRLSADARHAGVEAATRILGALDYVGVIGVEFFVVGEGETAQLLVNEIAPRVHNSGHWTMDAAITDQFEQHIRAVAGWPLGDPQRLRDVTMENLIGHDIDRVAALVAEPNAKLHLYGKDETRPGRKMGHVNWLAQD